MVKIVYWYGLKHKTISYMKPKSFEDRANYCPPRTFFIALESLGDILETSSRIEEMEELGIDYDD